MQTYQRSLAFCLEKLKDVRHLLLFQVDMAQPTQVLEAQRGIDLKRGHEPSHRNQNNMS